MPLIFEKKIENHTRLAVWETTEPKAFFADALRLSKVEVAHISTMNDRRSSEWLASRYLVHKLTGHHERIPVLKDYCGKPNLAERHEHISISHSRNRIAVAYSSRCVGIDIQHHEKKIIRIKSKFINASELGNIDSQHAVPSYHIFWGAKECMYKAYGLKKVDFKKHMHVYPFSYYQTDLELSGYLQKPDVKQEYHIQTFKLDDYYLVLAIKQKEIKY